MTFIIQARKLLEFNTFRTSCIIPDIYLVFEDKNSREGFARWNMHCCLAVNCNSCLVLIRIGNGILQTDKVQDLRLYIKSDSLFYFQMMNPTNLMGLLRSTDKLFKTIYYSRLCLRVCLFTNNDYQKPPWSNAMVFCKNVSYFYSKQCKRTVSFILHCCK